MKYWNQRKYWHLTVAGSFFTLLFLTIFLWGRASSYSRDLSNRFRAGHYQEIVRLYPGNPPDEPLERLILAESYIRTEGRGNVIRSSGGGKDFSRKLSRAITLYLSALDIPCPTLRNESDLEQCLRLLHPESFQGHIEKLAILRAGTLLARAGHPRTSSLLLTLASLHENDPLTRRILMIRLEELLDAGDLDAGWRLVESKKEWRDPDILLLTARLLYRRGDKKEAFAKYILAARTTASRSDLRSILAEVNQTYPNPLNENRSDTISPVGAYTAFVPVFRDGELLRLKRKMNLKRLVEKSTPESLQNDGLFLIRSRSSWRLKTLARNHYTQLSQHPSILYVWLVQLYNQKEYDLFSQLVRDFKHTRTRHAGIHKLYIEYLENHGDRKALFREMLAYLGEHHADYDVHDRLITFLIGKHPRRREWAPERYWRGAEKRLEGYTAAGRFRFWLRRYLLSRGKNQAVKRVDLDYYAAAPGTYYANFFWKLGRTGDFRHEWKEVKTRADYLRWVGRFGGNDGAIRFLSKQNLQPFLDPAGIRIWNKIRNMNYLIPTAVMDFYRMGEYGLASSFFDESSEGRMARAEELAHRLFIGRETDNLFLSVYYTRQLLRAEKVAEDPFSLPSGLLKALYPRPYLEYARTYGKRYGIEEEMIYSLMRQESMYRERAISRSGARGLMQVMPRTGAWLARRMKLKNYDLLNPETSIQLGAKYFADMLAANDHDFRAAAVAYNGGPGNLRRWKRKYYNGDFNVFLEFIPNRESRNYCRITYQNYQHYRITYLLYP